MLTNILVGILMMVVTTVVHAFFMMVNFDILERSSAHTHKHGLSVRLMMVCGTILMFFVAALIEVGVWATSYLLLGALQGLETALYYSMVTFTTLGYGDIVLPDRWRLLSSFEAANGIIMFGWTTAVVMAVVQRAFASVLKRIHEKRDARG